MYGIVGHARGVVTVMFQPIAHRPFCVLASSLRRNGHLIWEMAKREHADRYSGSTFGLIWTFGHPLATMLVYVIVFSYVFRIRVGGTIELPFDYTTYLIAGYLPWVALQESMIKSCTAITSNVYLVKEVVFPVEVLPVKGVVAAMLTQLIGTAFLIVYVLVMHGSIPWTYLLLPVVFALQLVAMIGAALVMSAVGPFVRDLKDVVQVLSVVGMYLVPVFYLPAWVPTVLRPVLYLNPLSYMIWSFQDVLYFGRIEHPVSWIIFAAGSAAILQAGATIFARLKPYFGNVL